MKRFIAFKQTDVIEGISRQDCLGVRNSLRLTTTVYQNDSCIGDT